MVRDFRRLWSLAREIEEQYGVSPWELVKNPNLSAEELKSLLARLGLTLEDLAGAKSLVEEMVAGMGEEEKRQLAEVLSRAIAGRENEVPEEVKDFLRRLRG